ncbi:MAG TPA: RNA polymerase factor sigma-54 [Thiotrichales bacterium]|nr:RNA polymerase factor sigma-54 [Thiotrichales bacterium]
MKQSIQLRLGQNLTMTPQLQQAIRLLQLSSMDLELEVQGILESNLMLEKAEEDAPETEAAPSVEELAEQEQRQAEAAEMEGAPEERESGSALESEVIPDELPVDTGWDEIYDGSTSYSQPASEENPEPYEIYRRSGESLRDHLLWQLELTPFSETDQAIALAIIDGVNEDGYLGVSLEEIHQGLVGELEVEPSEVEAVLHRIQRFDPVGVAARDLSECLAIQLQELPAETPWREEALEVVRHHLRLLAGRDFTHLTRRLRIDRDQLQEVIDLIQSLTPRPGSTIASSEPDYVIPDVIVTRRNGRWRVELNPDTVPRLRINSMYARMIRRADSSDDNTYLKNQLQEARWFLKSLQSRNETLLKVARCIVDRQREFLEHGEEAMKPLVLRDVAEAVEMHESTISRVTTQKYMHTPRGVFEFKYFFSSHVSTADGGECSATAIRAIIRKLVAEEDAARPLSDSKIAEILLARGIKVARRTVAKYRESMAIPPSNERKRLT